MTEMPENEKRNPCPKCGADQGSTPGGMCPSCLMQAAMDSDHPPTPELMSPETLARLFPEYEIHELLGRGGMGAVYRVRHKKLAREVALKVLLPNLADDPEFAARFTREARAMARLDHPNVVGVHDFGEREGLFYLMMEYVDGSNLRELIDGGTLTARDALKIVPQICDALQFAHERRIVHRDVKPENILVDEDLRVRIADFGLSKLLGEGGDKVVLTRTEQIFGTPQYMAPEQMKMTAEVDHRADIYSLGVVLYEMLTGDLPIGRFAVPSEKGDASESMDEVVLKSLANEPDQRYQSAEEVKAGVESSTASTTSTASPHKATTATNEAGETQIRLLPHGKHGLGVVVATIVVFIASFITWGSSRHTIDMGSGITVTMNGNAWNSDFFGFPCWLSVLFACCYTALYFVRNPRVQVKSSMFMLIAAIGVVQCGGWIIALASSLGAGQGPGSFLAGIAFCYLFYVAVPWEMLAKRKQLQLKLPVSERVSQVMLSRFVWMAFAGTVLMIVAVLMPWDIMANRGSAFKDPINVLVLLYAIAYLGEVVFSVWGRGVKPHLSALIALSCIGIGHSVLAILIYGDHAGPGPILSALVFALWLVLSVGSGKRRRLSKVGKAKLSEPMAKR